MLFITLDLASITSHIHNWVLFLLCLRFFILSGVISPLISSIVLGTYWPGECLFQNTLVWYWHAAAAAKLLQSCPTLRPHRRQPTRLPDPGILQARTLEWVAISFSRYWHNYAYFLWGWIACYQLGVIIYLCLSIYLCFRGEAWNYSSHYLFPLMILE